MSKKNRKKEVIPQPIYKVLSAVKKVVPIVAKVGIGVASLLI